MKIRRINFKLLKISKTFLTLIMLISVSLIHSQTTITISDPDFTCGDIVKLTAPDSATEDFYWEATGAVLLKEVNAMTAGNSVLTVSASNMVEAIISGSGTVKYTCSSCATIPQPTSSIQLTPQANIFNPEVSVSMGSINQPNNIQTRFAWICVSNSGSAQKLTVKNATEFSIFWSVNGGILKQNETYGQIASGEWVATVELITSAPNARKGFLRGYVSDSCGNFRCSVPVVDLEVLKDILPDTIFGVTCLRSDNLDDSQSTVYSVSDEIAGNAVYTWALVDELGTEFQGNSMFEIKSTVLYGNSATITYLGSNTPSSVGDFTIKVKNACGGSFLRKITVSPEAPIVEQATYCVEETAGSQEILKIASPVADQFYMWSVQGGNAWTIVPNNTSVGDEANVTFGDSASGIITVKACNSNDPNCCSSETIVYINRNGGDLTLDGPKCIKRGTTDSFAIIASVFGKFDWIVTPALPTDWILSGGGNVLTITPPASGINISGIYTVTATLDGCAGDTESFEFEIGPEMPIINGQTCVTPGVVYTYDIVSDSAVSADIRITTDSGIITNIQKALPGAFDYTAPAENFEIVVVTESMSGDCFSLESKLNVSVKPVVTNITTNDVCLALGSTPTVVFTAVDSGPISSYEWSYTLLSGGTITTTNNFLTLNLDENSIGEVSVIPYNNSCAGNAFTLDVSRNALDVTFSRVPAGPLFPNDFAIIATANIPLEMTWTYGAEQSEVEDCRGVLYGTIPTTATLSSARFFSPSDTSKAWMSVSVMDPVTNCERCYIVESAMVLQFAKSANKAFKNSLKLNKNGLKVLKNPVNEQLNIAIRKDVIVSQMTLFNAKGESVFSKEGALIKSKEQLIDTSSLAKGIYFLYSLTNYGIDSKKIIVK